MTTPDSVVSHIQAKNKIQIGYPVEEQVDWEDEIKSLTDDMTEVSVEQK